MASMRVTVDVVIFCIRRGVLNVLLIRRGIEPFKAMWAIPGGFILDGESLEAAARRELEEETGVRDVYLEQIYTFGDPARDPRGRVITVAYFALIDPESARLEAGTDAAEAKWFPVRGHPPLAFDHDAILKTAHELLRNKLDYTTVGFELLPEQFTLSELQRVYEAILGKKLDKRNFRRKVDALRIVKPLRKWKREGVQRPAQLHRFVRRG